MNTKERGSESPSVSPVNALRKASKRFGRRSPRDKMKRSAELKNAIVKLGFKS